MERIPIVRYGKTYESCETKTILDYRQQELAQISLAIPMIFQIDLEKRRALSAQKLRATKIAQIINWIETAGEIFATKTIMINGYAQSPEEYCSKIMIVTGLPYNTCQEVLIQIQRNMKSISEIISKQCRTDDLDILDTRIRSFHSMSYGWVPVADSLSIILPGNHPIVNMMWIIAFAMKYPVVIRPSFDDPFTPLRLIFSLIEAGADPEFFSYYPVVHAHVYDLMKAVGLGIIYGGEEIERLFGSYQWIKVFGSGNSKIVVGADFADRVDEVASFAAQSSLFHSGRACISASGIIAEKNGLKIAQAIGELFAQVKAKDLLDSSAILGAVKYPEMAKAIAGKIDAAVDGKKVIDVNPGQNTIEILDQITYLMPKVLYCNNPIEPIFGTEYAFPFLTVTEAPACDIAANLGKTLACSLLSANELLADQLLNSTELEKLFWGSIEPNQMDFGAPHKGFLVDFLYKCKSYIKKF